MPDTISQDWWALIQGILILCAGSVCVGVGGGGGFFQVGDLSNSMITKQQKYNLSNRFAAVKKLLYKE